MARLIVAGDRVKKLRNRYPWLYADEITGMEGQAEPGQVVELYTPAGDFLARAFYSPASHIRARILTYDPEEKINRAFFEQRIARAVSRRSAIAGTNAMRLVYAEADELPGLIVDRFADVLAVQFRNPGVERYRKEIVQALKRAVPAAGAFERSETQARTEEGLEARTGLLYGALPDTLEIFEDAVHYQIRVETGQKTGFYLDQRDNRRLLRSLLKPGDRVLDVFSYTGGFSLHAAQAGANSLAVDKDREALAELERNAARNGVSERVGARWGDAEQVLTALIQEKRVFSHIVLDPPTLAKHKNDLAPAKQLFTRLTASAIRLLAPEGILFVSTCAYHIMVNDLIETTRIAANDLGRRARVLTVTYQPADHPWILQVPETLYLKTLVLEVE